MTVAEMLERMSSVELRRWMIFYELEPFGADANFLGHAITSSTIANVHSGKDSKGYSPSDFMPKKKKPQTTEEMIGIASHITAAFGGKDLR